MIAAIVLLSGGIDSAAALALASETRRCFALTVDYGQRNYETESRCAEKIADLYYAKLHRAIVHNPVIAAASPVLAGPPSDNTYVPARNLVLLSLALAFAEIVGAVEIWIGANADDSGYYPDCRRAFFDAFEGVAAHGTKTEGVRVVSPWAEVPKGRVIREALRLGVPLARTTTCLMGRVAGEECGVCRACVLRRAAMTAEGIADPTRYRK